MTSFLWGIVIGFVGFHVVYFVGFAIVWYQTIHKTRRSPHAVQQDFQSLRDTLARHVARKRELSLFELEQGAGVVVEWPTGVVVGNQAGGVACYQPSVEGFFVPLTLSAELADESWSVEYPTIEEADRLDALLAGAPDDGGRDTGWRVHRPSLHRGYEAWIPVTRKASAPNDLEWPDWPCLYGWLTWSNSD